MHLKRIAAPKSWSIKRKKNKWIARPMPGPHKLRDSITINILLKDILNYAKTTKEIKKILNEGKVLINKKPRKDYRFPLSIMDVIEIPSLKESYILLYDKKGKFILNKIKLVNDKLCKIVGKTCLRKGKTQLNLNDGRNIIISKDIYKVGDSVMFDLSNNKIKSHFKLEKGSLIYLTGGSHKGYTGKLIEIKKGDINQKSKVLFKTDNKEYETLKEYSFVIDNINNLGVGVKK